MNYSPTLVGREKNILLRPAPVSPELVEMQNHERPVSTGTLPPFRSILFPSAANLKPFFSMSFVRVHHILERATPNELWRDWAKIRAANDYLNVRNFVTGLHARHNSVKHFGSAC
jgi:hypothetical protein